MTKHLTQLRHFVWQNLSRQLPKRNPGGLMLERNPGGLILERNRDRWLNHVFVNLIQFVTRKYQHFPIWITNRLDRQLRGLNWAIRFFLTCSNYGSIQFYANTAKNKTGYLMVSFVINCHNRLHFFQNITMFNR